MKFNFYVSRWANFYFFIQNLSMWHKSSREEYNKHWINLMGNLSDQDQAALKLFASVRKKYSNYGSIFEEAFYKSSKPMYDLEKAIGKEDHDLVLDTFNKFEDRFSNIYSSDENLLSSMCSELLLLCSEEKIAPFVDALNTLYNTSVVELEIDVYLLLSSPDHNGGGANIDNKSVTLEVSKVPPENINIIFLTLMHEIIHLKHDSSFNILIKNTCKETSESPEHIRELVAESLLPNGILGTQKNSKLRGINQDQTNKIITLSKLYLDKQKPFDEDYINNLIAIKKT